MLFAVEHFHGAQRTFRKICRDRVEQTDDFIVLSFVKGLSDDGGRNERRDAARKETEGDLHHLRVRIDEPDNEHDHADHDHDHIQQTFFEFLHQDIFLIHRHSPCIARGPFSYAPTDIHIK